MSVKTCLLVTDDPDDHQAFSEAFSEISAQAVVLIVLDSNKAVELLRTEKHVPDYLFVDLSMHGIEIRPFLKILRQQARLSRIPTVLYGEESVFDEIADRSGLLFFSKEYGYSGLRNFIKEFI
jgi:CheY-like chemotaxis protein